MPGNEKKTSLPCFSLHGKTVIVTGAGRGIGRTIALDAHRSGARIMAGSRTVDELDSLSRVISDEGGVCWTHRLDVADLQSIESFIDASAEHYGAIDVLINNAGFNSQKSILDYDELLYDKIVDTNLKSVFFCSQVVARRMIDQGNGGSIVNISSQAGLMGAPMRAPYSAAKGGVINLTRTMAVEWAEHRIRVNAVAPTVTRSPMAEQAMRENPAFADAVKTNNLLRGDLAEPSEIAGPVIFLASEAASMITGHTLVVDGGWTIQ